MVVTISAVLIAVLVVAVSALGTTLLGVPTTYSTGVDSHLGAQVVRDFLGDQDAEAIALSNSDPSAISDRLSGNALVEVGQQISDQSKGGSAATISFQPSSLTVLKAQDPVDPSLILEVQEDGAKTVTTASGPNAAPSQQTVGFHGNFWLRQDATGRYLIADQNIQNQPSSILPAVALAAAGLVIVGIATLLVIRQRRPRQMLQPVPGGEPLSPPILIDVAEDLEPSTELSGPAPEMVVKTFGGLRVMQGGNDWAQALMSRPVTGFVWLRLLVTAIRDPNARPSRDEIARQASPGFRRDTQLKRLRNVIGKGLPKMPAPLRERILVEPQAMGFRLDGCAVDAIELLAVSAEFSGRNQLSAAQASKVQRVLQACQGAFLPEFDAIENLATDRHPTCTELVRDLRELLITRRVDLSLILGDVHLRNGRPLQAIGVLEPALSDRVERKDLADRLALAYRAVGRDAEAKALEARYS